MHTHTGVMCNIYIVCYDHKCLSLTFFVYSVFGLSTFYLFGFFLKFFFHLFCVSRRLGRCIQRSILNYAESLRRNWDSLSDFSIYLLSFHFIYTAVSQKFTLKKILKRKRWEEHFFFTFLLLFLCYCSFQFLVIHRYFHRCLLFFFFFW